MGSIGQVWSANHVAATQPYLILNVVQSQRGTLFRVFTRHEKRIRQGWNNPFDAARMNLAEISELQRIHMTIAIRQQGC